MEDSATTAITAQQVVLFILPLAIALARKYSNRASSETLENGRFRNSCVNNILQRRCDDIVPFHHQVGGHRNEVVLALEGLVLKPMIKEPYFMRELKLYEKLYAPNQPLLPSLRTFMPKYHGLIFHLERPYIVLSDQTAHCEKACSCDIKMGTQTFEPGVSLQKQMKEEGKYAFQRATGFRIIGYKSYQVTTSSYISVGKDFGRNLAPDKVQDGLGAFFHNGQTIRRDVVIVVIDKLERMFQWFKRQTDYHFYGTSLLIVYDGANPVTDRDQVKVNLIDFAHTVISPDRSVDNKFIFGLKNLIVTLHHIASLTGGIDAIP